jgi:hypothetical protein
VLRDSVQSHAGLRSKMSPHTAANAIVKRSTLGAFGVDRSG